MALVYHCVDKYDFIDLAFKGQCSVWAKARQALFLSPRLKSRGDGIGNWEIDFSVAPGTRLPCLRQVNRTGWLIQGANLTLLTGLWPKTRNTEPITIGLSGIIASLN